MGGGRSIQKIVLRNKTLTLFKMGEGGYASKKNGEQELIFPWNFGTIPNILLRIKVLKIELKKTLLWQPFYDNPFMTS